MSADPADHTPEVLNGHVNAFAQVGNQMIVGGMFSQVRSGATVYARANLFSFDVTTGAISTTFTPAATGEVFDLQISPSQGYVIAVGSFRSIGSKAHTARVAALNVSDGSVLTSFRPPAFDKPVRDIGYARGTYYVTGDFTRAGNVARSGLASLDPMGKLTVRANLAVSGRATGRPGASKIRTSDISPNGRSMVIAGDFAAVAGKRRPQIALLSLNRGKARLSRWSTNAYAPACGKKFNTYMRDVAFAPQNNYFVAVTTGGPKGYQASGRMCDTAARWRVSDTAHQSPAWIDFTGGDTLTAVIVDRRVVYVGGHQRWLNNSYGRNSAAAGAVSRSGIAALDPANGLPLSWNPGRGRGYGVFGFALTSQGLWVGSDTTSLGGEVHPRLGMFASAGGTPVPAYSTGRLPGRLLELGVKRTNQVRTRAFNGTHVGAPKPVSAASAWRRVRGAFVINHTLYTSWPDRTLRAAPLNGSGALTRGTPINLGGGFSDLARARGMFFDRTTHPLYYTLAGSKALHYRYFQPQSQIVGSWRYRAEDRGTNWSGVRSTFLVGSRLYYVSKSGRLHRVAWHRDGRTVGNAKAIGRGKVGSESTVLTPRH